MSTREDYKREYLNLRENDKRYKRYTFNMYYDDNFPRNGKLNNPIALFNNVIVNLEEYIDRNKLRITYRDYANGLGTDEDEAGNLYGLCTQYGMGIARYFEPIRVYMMLPDGHKFYLEKDHSTKGYCEYETSCGGEYYENLKPLQEYEVSNLEKYLTQLFWLRDWAENGGR